MIVGRQQFGLEIDLSNIIGDAGQKAVDQFKNALIGGIAATPQVRQAVAASGQEAAAKGLADTILANKTLIVGGGIMVLALLTFLTVRR